MRTEHFYPSAGAGKIRYLRWTPEMPPKAVVQIVHGIAEHVERYEDFANFLNGLGILVVAEDHMGHGRSGETRGYFHGGWFTAVEDTYALTRKLREEFPQLPLVIFGHSMGSFMTRTILCKHPRADIAGAVICGSGWMSPAVLKMGIAAANLVCRRMGDKTPSAKLQAMMFAGYNRRVEHPRTGFDWLTRDRRVVDAYVADPLCGFTASCGLLRDMLMGMTYIQTEKKLRKMNKKLLVLFIAGGDDPVGSYGKGVRRAAEEFRKLGMTDVSEKIYPLCRHELLNELNKQEVYEDVAKWLEKVMA